MYSPHGDVDAVFRSPMVHLYLPPLSMGYYGVFPVSVAADAIVQPAFPDEAAMHAQASLMVLRAQLLSVAYREVLWNLGLGSTYPSARHAARAAKWRRNLHHKGRRPCAPVVNVMCEYLKKNGCEVMLSQTFAALTPDTNFVTALKLDQAMEKCSSWIDVLDVVAKAPMAALDAYINPKKSTALMQPGVRYKLDKISPHALPSNVAALKACGATFEVIHKLKTDLNWKVSPLVPFNDKYGLPPDRPFPNFAVDDLTKHHITATLPTAAAAVAMHNHDQVRKEWKWYISGTGDKPAGDDFSDDASVHATTVKADIHALEDPTSEEIGPPPDPTASSMNLGQMLKSVAEASEQKKADTQAPPKANKGTLPRKAAWHYEDLMLAAPGVLRQVAERYKEAVLEEENQPGRDIKDHMEPLVAPIATTLSNISFVQAVSGVARNKRVSVMVAASTALQKLAQTVNDQRVAKQLCYGAQRALNTASALKKCTAINAAELADDKMCWTEEAAGVIENIADQLVEAGMSLGDLAAPAPVGVDSKEISMDEVQQAEDEGWRRNRNQAGAPAGKVRVYKPRKATPPNVSFEGAMSLIIEANDEVQRKAERLLEEIAAPTAAKGAKILEVELPPGEEQRARDINREAVSATKAKKELELQADEVRKQISHFKAKEADYNDPARKEYVHSKALALELALESGETAQELSDAMIAAIGQPHSDFGRAGAPPAATLAGSLEQQNITGGGAWDVDLEMEEGALGPVPASSQPSPPASIVDPNDLPSLETD